MRALAIGALAAACVSCEGEPSCASLACGSYLELIPTCSTVARCTLNGVATQTARVATSNMTRDRLRIDVSVQKFDGTIAIDLLPPAPDTVYTPPILWVNGTLIRSFTTGTNYGDLTRFSYSTQASAPTELTSVEIMTPTLQRPHDLRVLVGHRQFCVDCRE